MSEKGKVSPFPCFRAHEGTQVNQNLSRPVRSTGLAEPGEPAREMERTGVIMFIHILPVVSASLHSITYSRHRHFVTMARTPLLHT